MTTSDDEFLSRDDRSRVLSSVDDAAMVPCLRGGDVRAFDAVYAKLGDRIFSFLLRLSGRRDLAEDLAQETWLKFARAAKTLPDGTRLSPYVFTIARNAFRSHRRWAVLDLSRVVLAGLEAVKTSPAPDEEHERAHDVALLEGALAKLPLATREILLLVGVEGLPHEDVAAMMAIRPDALRQRLHRAREDLRAEIALLERKKPPFPVDAHERR